MDRIVTAAAVVEVDDAAGCARGLDRRLFDRRHHAAPASEEPAPDDEIRHVLVPWA